MHRRPHRPRSSTSSTRRLTLASPIPARLALARVQGIGTILTGVTFIDPSKQTATNDAQAIYVFNVKPIGSYMDQASCSLAAADIPLLVGQVAISARSCISDAANTVCTIRPSLAIPPPSATYSLATQKRGDFNGSCFNKCTIMARRVGLCPCEVSSFFKAREKTLFA